MRLLDWAGLNLISPSHGGTSPALAIAFKVMGFSDSGTPKPKIYIQFQLLVQNERKFQLILYNLIILRFHQNYQFSSGDFRSELAGQTKFLRG